MATDLPSLGHCSFSQKAGTIGRTADIAVNFAKFFG